MQRFEGQANAGRLFQLQDLLRLFGGEAKRQGLQRSWPSDGNVAMRYEMYRLSLDGFQFDRLAGLLNELLTLLLALGRLNL